MLWYKAWLETRGRFLALLAFLVFVCAVLSPAMRQAKSDTTVRFALHYSQWPRVALVLAGAGINTQTMSGTRHAIHPSMYFTLALPVRRGRLLAVRAAAGALETVALVSAGCLAAWVLSPVLRGRVTVPEMAVYLFTASAAASVAYSLGVLLATFLDESWQIYAGGAGILLLWLAESHVPGLGPAPFGHVYWPQVAFCTAASAALLAAAVRIAGRKQY